MAGSGDIKRREFLIRSGLLAGASACSGLAGILQARAAPAIVASNAERPLLAQGIQIGDVLADRAILWSRSDRAARLLVEWDLDERFRRPRLVRGPHALEDTDFTARVDLRELPPGQDVFVRVRFAGLSNERALSAPVLGHFRTPSPRRREVRFAWSGDTAGQGFGINPEFGGMRIYETMRRRCPDFFLHSGDTIYADGPIPAEKVVEDGKIWRNQITLDPWQRTLRAALVDINDVTVFEKTLTAVE